MHWTFYHFGLKFIFVSDQCTVNSQGIQDACAAQTGSCQDYALMEPQDQLVVVMFTRGGYRGGGEGHVIEDKGRSG